MRVLRRIWTDVQRGENVDLYLTVLAALILVLLNLLGIAPASLLSPLTLAVLGLLALATLGNRYQFEELVNRIAKSSTTFFQSEIATTFERDLQNATELWLVGVSLSRTVKSHYSLLENLLKQGTTIRVLLVDPNCSESVAAVAKREYRGRFHSERIRTQIRDTLDDLGGLKQVAPDQLAIRVIQFPLSFGATVINPTLATGVLHLEHYSYKMPGGSVPKFTLKPQDGQWYDFYRTEVEMLWKDAVEWQG